MEGVFFILVFVGVIAITALLFGVWIVVAVARVIARSPRLVLADEPTSSLDSRNAIRVIEALLAAIDAQGTLIVATHDERVGAYFKEVWTLEDGEIR